MKRSKSTFLCFLMCSVMIGLSGILTYLPWWTFIIPVGTVGGIAGMLKWKVMPFATGFISGFTTWFGTTILLHFTQNGIVFNKLADLIHANVMVVPLISGLIGGLLAGLAFLAGYTLSSPENIYNLNDQID